MGYVDADRVTWSTVFLLAAAVVSLVWWVPQLLRVLRGDAVGVSADTWAMTVANLLLWGLWGATAGQWVAASVEWIQAVGSAAVVVKVGPTRRALWLAGMVAAVVGVAQAWPLAASVAAVGSAVAVRVPQLIGLLRARDRVHAVSGVAWLMSAASNVLWVGWGITGGHPTMIVGAGLSVLASSGIAIASRAGRG